MSNLKAKHPHHEVILAYLNGETVQYDYRGNWVDIHPFTERMQFPNFDKKTQYRVKPPEPVIKHRYVFRYKWEWDVSSNWYASIEEAKAGCGGELHQRIDASAKEFPA